MADRALAIVGAGPKAAAIAAKASVLRDLAGIDIRTTIFEESVPGAAWDGSHGLTDGEQRMCTVAERDIGFPYDAKEFGQSIATAMQQRYSWQSHAVDTEQYSEWIDRGRRRLPHATFAAYIRWCIEKSAASVVTGKVTGLSHRDAKWQVEVETSGGAKTHPESFDGVVVTGTGPAKRRFYPDPNPLVLDENPSGRSPRI